MYICVKLESLSVGTVWAHILICVCGSSIVHALVW
jgi:hypothetical protein